MNRRDFWRDVLFTVAWGVMWAVIAGGSAWLLIKVDAQEKDPSYPRTRVWRIAETNNLYIVETAGVCIYWSPDGLAAVPKTQLPKGAGCQ